MANRHLPPYRTSIAGTLLVARESVMAPLRGFLREAGLTDQQWRVLRVLQYEKGVDPSGLAAAALLHAPSVTRILKDLVERGLVGRRSDPRDGRRALLVLLPAGRALVERTAAHSGYVLDRIAARFGEERLAHLRRELIALAASVEGVALEAPRSMRARAGTNAMQPTSKPAKKPAKARPAARRSRA